MTGNKFYILNSTTMIVYNKLIRDKIIEKIENNWGTAKHHIAGNEEFEIKLKEKLVEESKELNETKNLDEIKNELADVLKITQEIMIYYNISEEEIKVIMQKKDEKAGWFDKRIILDEASEF